MKNLKLMVRNLLIFAMVLTSASIFAQSVGVGTTSPNNKAILDVTVPNPSGNPQGMLLPRLASAERTSMTLGSTEAGLIVYDTGDNEIYRWDGSAWQIVGSGTSWGLTGNTGTSSSTDFVGTTDATDLAFRTNNTERFIIKSSGNVGFGTSTPSGPFHVSADNDGTLDSLFMVDAGGNVGIGVVANTSYKLRVAGNVSTNGINETSDARWKKDVNEIQDPLGKVLQLRGVTYFWRVEEFPGKNFEESKQLGFIAQEVEQVIPEVVNTDPEGYKGVEYSKLVALLTEAIKEQQKQIEELKVKVRSQSNQLKNTAQLEERLKQLEKKMSVELSEIE